MADIRTLKLQLLADRRVITSQGSTVWPPHGDWYYDQQADTFEILFNWQGDNNRTKRHYYVRIPHTSCYERIHCSPDWISTLLPVTG
jgi:hypothetical protein